MYKTRIKTTVHKEENTKNMDMVGESNYHCLASAISCVSIIDWANTNTNTSAQTVDHVAKNDYKSGIFENLA